MAHVVEACTLDNVIVTRKQILKNYEQATRLAIVKEGLKMIPEHALNAKIRYRADKARKDSFGFTHPYGSFIALTKNLFIYETMPDKKNVWFTQLIATISHEVLHVVVVENEDVKTSRALDACTRRRKSILKRLAKEGYLGGQDYDKL